MTPTTLRDRRIAFAIALLALAIYLTTTSLRFQSIDEVAVFTVARNLAARASFDGDILYWRQSIMSIGSIVADGHDGHSYVVKDVAPSLVSVPLIWLARLLPVSPIRAALLLSPLVTATTVAVLYLVIRSWRYTTAIALLGSLTLGLASLAWPYAETIFAQTLAALGLLLALWGTVQARQDSDWHPALTAGLGLGLAGLSAIPTWITLPAHILYLLPPSIPHRDSL